MIPVTIIAQITGQLGNPREPVALDGLLAAMVVLRDEIPPAGRYEDMTPIEIPIARSKCGRFHLCSHSIQRVEEMDEHTRYMNRRPVIAEAQMLSRPEGKGAIKRMQINAGPSKGYRVPLETGHLEDDEMVWYAMATDVGELRSLLSHCTHIGRRRAVGLGRVASWDVSEHGTWEGFPVLWKGSPTRPLPVGHPGLLQGAGWETRRRLTYPYWCGPKEPVSCPRPR